MPLGAATPAAQIRKFIRPTCNLLKFIFIYETVIIRKRETNDVTLSR